MFARENNAKSWGGGGGDCQSWKYHIWFRSGGGGGGGGGGGPCQPPKYMVLVVCMTDDGGIVHPYHNVDKFLLGSVPT